MIIQEIYCDGEKFFTIIHNDMDNDIKERIIQKSINISMHNILFKEYYIEKYQIDDKYEFFIEGFLDCQNEKNPYANYSTYFKEYNYLNKTQNILNFSFKDFKKLYDFIYEYTNFKFTKLNSNNVMKFYPSKILVKAFNSETTSYLTIKSSVYIRKISVKFKLNDIILESININGMPEENKIIPNKKWNNYEIEIFDDEKILYKSHNHIHLSINFSIGINTNDRRVQLNKFDKKINFSKSNTENLVISNEKKLNYISNYLFGESKYRNELENKNECYFLRKNEREKAYGIFEKIVKNEGELFIFDPYFLNESAGKDVLKDLLIIILSHNNLINIIFSQYIGESFENFKNSLNTDEKLFFKTLGIDRIKFIN